MIIAIGVAAVVYLLLDFTGGSPGGRRAGNALQPSHRRRWNKPHGYDRPLVVQIVDYVWNAVHLKFGYSYKQGQSVAALLNEDAGRTAYLSGAALVLALLIAVPLGIAQAVKRNSVGDYVATGIAFTLYSMPSFFLGLILIQLFALDLHILPAFVSDNITTTWQAFTHPAPDGAADRDACRAHRRELQPLHALLGARCPGAGLHPPRSRQGPARAGRAWLATCCATHACR